ncbi:hypothetical protein [Erwinia phage Pecta]|nr:hypothetical protein [Erwinia phage Pecta]
MELAILFYLAGVVGNLQFVLVSISLVGLCASVAAVFAMVDINGTVKGYKRYPIICLLILLFSILLPSKSTIYTMAAAYGVQEAATNPDVQRLAGKSFKLLEQKLDEYSSNKK